MKRVLRWASQRILLGVAAMAALSAVGAIWQTLASATDRRSFPPPGKLVDVGGYRLHIHCAGAGRPTVLLEAGSLSMSAQWAWVQPAVAAYTRVCSYDRAGLGWSAPGPEPRDALRIAKELRNLLQNAGETGPYVLVGHSSGGLLIRWPDDRARRPLKRIRHRPRLIAAFWKQAELVSFIAHQ